MIAVWTTSEIANDTWRQTVDNHRRHPKAASTPAGSGPGVPYERMPTRNAQPDSSGTAASFGNLWSCIIDTAWWRDEQLDYTKFFTCHRL